MILALGYFASLALVVGTLAYFFVRWLQKTRLFAELELRPLLVRIPKPTAEKKDPKETLQEIDKTSQLFTALAGLKSPFGVEVAVHYVGEEIHFYLIVPLRAAEYAARAVHGFWPDAQVERADDYNIFNPTGYSLGAFLKQRRGITLPIRTYTEVNVDTFMPILSTFSKLQAVGEGLAFQMMLEPAPRSVRKDMLKYAEHLRKGKTITKRDWKEKGIIPEKMEKRTVDIQDEDRIKLVQQKVAKPLFRANVRLIASAENQFRAEELLQGLASGFSQFNSVVGNELRVVKARNPHSLFAEFSFREFRRSEALVVNSEELASMFHFPTSQTEVPRVKSVKAREAAPPNELASGGVQIGESVFRGETRPIFITDEDRRRHIYLVGQTGTGKSNLLVNMATSDIARGKGVALIDPHGDLIDKMLSAIPQNRVQDVVVFDPGDIERPIGLNMLEYDPTKPEQKTFIVNEMINIFDKLYDLKTTGGPMFEQYMRNALILLMEDTSEPATLVEVPRVFSDAEYRRRKLAKATTPTVIDFWEKEAVKAGGEASLANITPYITSKFNNFIANDYVRPIIGQQKSAFKFRTIMDDRKILLVNLSKGRIGDINASLIGMVMVGKILMAALSRVDTPEDQRVDFNLYIDEFQNFATESIATILSEARKYRLNLVIAHQFIKQLLEKIRDAVFGNVGSLIAFRVGAEDGEFLEKQFEPVFTRNDLINIDNYNAYAKLLINGQTSRPFSIHTLPAKKGDPAIGAKLRELSRLTYGRPRAEVEADILQRLRR